MYDPDAFERWLRVEYASCPVRWRDDTRPFIYLDQPVLNEATGEVIEQPRVLLPLDFVESIERTIAMAGGLEHIRIRE